MVFRHTHQGTIPRTPPTATSHYHNKQVTVVTHDLKKQANYSLLPCGETVALPCLRSGAANAPVEKALKSANPRRLGQEPNSISRRGIAKDMASCPIAVTLSA